MDEKRPLVEFERLNWLGKAVYLGGAATHLASRAIEFGIDKASTVWVVTERAFRDGLGDGIEDARVIEEERRDDRTRPREDI
jgi:hypothetical protein